MILRSRLRFRPRLPNIDLPDLKVSRLAIDIDTKDPSVLSTFLSRLKEVKHLIIPYEPYVVFYKGKDNAKGYHVLFEFKKPMSLRDNLALRLYLLDDPKHIYYDLYAWIFTPRFPTNVLFTAKPSQNKKYVRVYEGTLPSFLDFLSRRVNSLK